MSQDQNTEVIEKQVLSDLSEATGTEVSVGDLAKMVQVRYEVALSQLLLNISNMSPRQITRVVSNAIDLPIQSGLGKKFTKEIKAKTAALMAQVIDLRNILQADKMNKEEEAKNNATR